MEGDRGAGAQENRGREAYGRWEERGREAGFPKWREPGENKENFAILFHILQHEENRKAGTPMEGDGKRE